MAWIRISRETRVRIKEVVEWFEPKLSLFVVLGFAVAALLASRAAHNGGEQVSEQREHAKHLRENFEYLDYLCLGCGLVVASLGVLRWVSKKTAVVHEHFDPQSDSPVRVSTLGAGLIFKTDSGEDAPLYRLFIPAKHELELFVEWSNEDEWIQDATGLSPFDRKLLYERWYEANPRSFLILERLDAPWQKTWRPMALSIMLALPLKTADALRQGRLTVVNLTTDDLRFPAGERENAHLLYDTLIFHARLRSRYAEFKRWHSIFHCAQFASPTAADPVAIWIEPDNEKLKKSLHKGRYGQYSQFKLANGHEIYELVLPGASAASERAAVFEMFWRLLRIKGWTIRTGRP